MPLARDFFKLANIISCSRVLLMFYAFWHFLETDSNISFFLLTILVIVLDAVDGIVARALREESKLGAKLDIYCDRVVELGYWYFFAYQHYIGFWVFSFFLVRGLVVDFLSAKLSKPLGDSFLRSSRFMRFFYGFLKLSSFALLILGFDMNLAHIFVYLTVLICFLRALPLFFKSRL